jgi:hypothetical protein
MKERGMITMTENFKTIIGAMHLNWANPEEINMKWFGKDHDTLREILSVIYPDCDIDNLAFLFHCYDYLENQILAFIEADGFAYDKSRWILKQYFEDLIGGAPDSIDECRKTYHPEFGTTDDWLDFIKAAADMYRNGINTKNMKAFDRMSNLQSIYLNGGENW